MRDKENRIKTIFDEDESVIFRYNIKNIIGKKVTIGFSSSQRVRAIFLNENQEIVHDFDADFMYMMALSEISIEPHDSIFFAVPLSTIRLTKGRYKILASLALRDETNQSLYQGSKSQFQAELEFEVS